LTYPQQTALIGTANHLMCHFLETHIGSFFRCMDLALLENADVPKTFAVRQKILDAYAQFRTEHTQIGLQVINSVTEQALSLVGGPDSIPSDANGPTVNTRLTLALIEKDEFEDWLVVRVSISKAELHLRAQLLELQLRLDAGFASVQVPEISNPYSPSAMGLAMADAVRHLRLGNQVLKLVFQIFHEVVLLELESIYAKLNSLLLEAGVLPDLNISRYLASQNAHPTDAQPDAEPSSEQASGPVTNTSDPAQLESAAATVSPTDSDQPFASSSPAGRIKAAFSAASRLWSMQRQLTNAPPGSSRPEVAELAPPSPSTTEVLDAVRQVQRDMLSGHAQLDAPGALKRYLLQASGAGGKVSAHECDSADMVEGLFDNIVQNERVIEDLRGELRKLEVPILKIMLEDPTLFTADFHPARQAVNYLALLSDKRSININQNRPVILNTIAGLLQSQGSDNAGFTDALASLDQLVGREKHFFERNLSRVTEACEGQQQIVQANLLIDWELYRLLGNQPVAQPIIDLVENGWKELMRLSYLREGTSSLAWEMTLVVIDQLLVRTVPGAYEESRLRFSASKLMTLISKGLSKIPHSRASHKTLIRDLETLLANPHDAEFAQVRFISPLQEDPGDHGAQDRHMLRWLKRARNLKVGQWLEGHTSDAGPQLLYLAWVADACSRYVFSNHRGMKAAELTLEEVAERLRDGRLSILNDASMPALEQGLDALVQKVYDKLAHETAQDSLTGLRTRREFVRWLSQSVTQAREGKNQYVLIFIDVLQFKLINNTCGYEVGDHFLRDIAATILAELDAEAISGRVGVDQFCVLLPSQSRPADFALAERLKTAIEQNRFVSGGHSFTIQSAVAMMTVGAETPDSMELLRTVESAADLCKKSGHRDIQQLKPGDARFRERDEVISWVTRINHALDNNLLKVRCQKIAPVKGAGSTDTHYETLLTVIDENGEHLPPADFIRAAEEYNRMGAVDRWVIETVLGWMADHREDLDHFGGFSINLSGCSLNDDSLLDFIFATLVRFNIPCNKLIFEVTETAAIENLEDAADFINEMKEIGCRFSLDDFGTGQSSYAYLKRLPVDFIKIDGTFVRNIVTDNFDFALVRSITEMGHFLNKKIVAEFVSSPEILEVVSSIGVDYAQGFHIGRPILLDDLQLNPGNPANAAARL
jgi:diguanylate cyclase (GGDEF)-like protein